MKKRICNVLLFLAVSIASVTATQTGDITDLLKGLGSGSSESSSGVLSGLGSVLNGVLSTSKISISDVVGSWKYVEPAVEFKSENLLKKAGGSAAAATITDKIKPYYEKAGITNLEFIVKEDGSFTLGVGKIKMSGTLQASDTDGAFIFNFKAVGSLSLGKITGYLSKNISGQLTLTFDASKLISLVNGIAKLSANSTLQTVSSLLNSYDGLTVGFVLKKS